jgi:hypothetical protein
VHHVSNEHPAAACLTTNVDLIWIAGEGSMPPDRAARR